MITNQETYPDASAKGNFTPLQMEAALCIWEDLLERHRAQCECDRTGEVIFPDDKQAREFSIKLHDFWENNGTVEMRHAAINISARAVEDFAALEAAIGLDEIFETWGTYDWEWIPAWVYATVDTQGHQLLLKDSGTVVQGMIREHYKHRVSRQMWLGAVSRGETEMGLTQWQDHMIERMRMEGHVGV